MKLTLYNFWWLLIWVFAAGGLCALMPRQYDMVLGHRKVRWRPLSAILLALPYVIWAGHRNNAWGDVTAYRRTFLAAPAALSELGRYVANAPKDKGYSAFVVIFKALISQSDKTFFTIVALIQIACLVYIFRKYSENYWLSFFLFIASADYISWVYNGMRQFIAVSILFACGPLILKKKNIPLVLILLAVSTIHMSALIMLPFIFIARGKAWNKYMLFFLVVVAGAMVYLEEFTEILASFMDNSQYSAETKELLRDEGANIIRVLFYSVPTIGSLIYLKKIRSINNPLVNICVNMSIASTGFYVVAYFTSGIYIGRIPIFFSLYNYLLYPWMLKRVIPKQYAAGAASILVLVYTVYFYYQMGVTWGML